MRMYFIVVTCVFSLYRYKSIITLEENKEISSNYDIILCTCNETCSQRMLHTKGRIAQCIVDECGMATEPETISAASLCEHVVLIGDHKQLQPVIKYSPAKECGLGTSLFERYATLFEKTNDPHLITLELQYRMASYGLCFVWLLFVLFSIDLYAENRQIFFMLKS